MKIRLMIHSLLFVLILAAAPAAFAQQQQPQPDAEAARDKTRQRLGTLLQRVGPDISVNFQPSSKSQFVFTGVMREGLKNAER